MLRKLLAGLSVLMGAQILLPPIFVGNWNPYASQIAVAAELAEIRDRGHLIVGIKTNRPPLGFIDQAGNISGFEVDIARRLAADLLGDENAIRFVPLTNIDRLNAVLEDRVDIAIAAITLTEPRRRLVNFSDPYYLDGTAFLVNPSSIQSLPDLRLSPIAVLDRSSTVAHVRYILPGARLVSVESYEEGQALLARGDVDAFAGDASVLTGWLHPQATLENVSLLPDVISAEPLAIALPKGTQYHDLQAAINRSIRHWYAEGWLQANADFWALPSGLESSESAESVDE